MTVSTLWLAGAGTLCFILAAIHSALGERLIFRHWAESPPIPRSHAGIIRASWHVLSFFGIALGAILWRGGIDGVSIAAVALACYGSAVLIAVWTRFRHAGWIVMILIGTMAALSRL